LGKTNEPDGPARGLKRTFVCFLSAFDPSPAQVCAVFGVKRTACGQAGRVHVSSLGPPIGGTGTPFSIRPPPSLRPHSLHSSLLFSTLPLAAAAAAAAARRPDLGLIRSVLSSPGCGRPRRAMDWPGTGPEGPGKAARPHAGSGSFSSRSDLLRRWSAGRYTNGGRPGSVLAQKLVGAPLPLITCDDCPKKVLRRVSATPEHPGWVFVKCSTDGVCATLASVVLLD